MKRPVTRRRATSTPQRGRRFALLVALAWWCLAGFDPAKAAHAAVGTPVANAKMRTLDGGSAFPLGDASVSVLVFFRPNQERSLGGLRELAQCQGGFAGKSVRWAGVVSDSVSAESAAALAREARFVGPVLVDTADALYGSLGISLHPVVLVVGQDHKLAAFEPFRSVDYCSIVGAHIRYALREISDEELRQALAPPKASEGGGDQVARRYRALAAAQFKAGNYDKALESARKSIDSNPQMAAAHALMGEILLAQGNCSGAAAAYAKALVIDPALAGPTTGMERCRAPR